MKIRSSIFIRLLLLLQVLFTTSGISAQTIHDTIKIQDIDKDKQDNGNIITRIIKYFESSNKGPVSRYPKFSFIGGPHYSSDTKLGLGILSAGLYSTEPDNETLQPSNITLFANLTTGKYFKVGVEGLHLYQKDSRRIDYEFSFNSYSTYYWGVGVDNALNDKNKSKYLLLNVNISVDHLWELSRNLYIGPILGYKYSDARHIHNADFWDGQPNNASLIQIGAKLQLDYRDNYTAPTSGWLAEGVFGYNKGVSINNSSFLSINFNVCNYVKVWKSGVIASRLHGDINVGDTPWCNMPTLGASGTMRGYYEGQYRDKNEFDMTVELRQNLYRRSGIVAWGGIGTVFPSLRKLQSKHILPSYGLGYRWEFKKNTNVRLDLGFGKRCWGVEFNIGEAF